MPLAAAIDAEPASEDSFRTVESPPLVSIVIPVKNDARRLSVCLKSLTAQTYPDDRFEMIVVDNGSVDDSASAAIALGARVVSEPNRRVGGLRNLGVQQARGDVLAFVDADHELPDDWLANGVAAIRSPESPSAAGAPCLAPHSGTWVQIYWEKHRLRAQDRRLVDWLGAGNMFVQREAFDRAGGFREDLVAAEDVDLCLRLQAQGGTILGDPAIRNIHHGEPSTLWQFCRKEYWRGSSGVKAFFLQGCPLRELPSLLFPAYHLAALAAFVAAIVFGLLGGSLLWIPVALALLMTPALLLAIHTGWRCRRIDAILPLAVLYLSYGLTRAAALFKP